MMKNDMQGSLILWNHQSTKMVKFIDEENLNWIFHVQKRTEKERKIIEKNSLSW